MVDEQVNRAMCEWIAYGEAATDGRVLCKDLYGVPTVLGSVFFVLNLVYPIAPNATVIRALARMTATIQWLDAFAGVAQRPDFESHWRCFVATAPFFELALLLPPIVVLVVELIACICKHTFSRLVRRTTCQ